MHNNLITDLPDFVTTELIQTEKYLTFIADYKIDHVKCLICCKKTDNIHDKSHQSIQIILFKDKKSYY